MIDFTLPSLGADMDWAKLNCWLVALGDTVHRGQIVAEVETEKAVLEVECWYDGVIEEIVVNPGPDHLAVGTVLARIRPVETPAQPAAPAVAPSGPQRAERQRPPERRPGRPTPPIRHLAHELGVDLGQVAGSGPDGAITRDDVTRSGVRTEDTTPAGVATAERPKASPRARALAVQLGVDLRSVPPGGPFDMVTAGDVEAAALLVTEAEDKVAVMRRAIARSMARSKREIPHYYLATHIDLDRAIHWLDDQNAERSVADRMLPVALLLKATALALRETPDLNGYWIEDAFHAVDAIHLGVAVSLREGGLVAPAIHDADLLDLDELMARLRDLVNRARSWRLRSSEMSDPTVTVTNLGDRGVETAFPVIIPPQVAMVGFGRVIDAPVAVAGSPTVHPVVHATLAADHRVTDGHRGGLFLDALDKRLQHPEAL